MQNAIDAGEPTRNRYRSLGSVWLEACRKPAYKLIFLAVSQLASNMGRGNPFMLDVEYYFSRLVQQRELRSIIRRTIQGA